MMRRCTLVIPREYVEYNRAHLFQLDVLQARIEQKIDMDVLIILEHSPVFTIGRHGRWENMLVSPSFLKKKGIGLVSVERGGDITFHGPGQVVAYPIFSLKSPRVGVRDFVFLLEEVMIKIGQRVGLKLVREELNRGVWFEKSKIGSVGISIRRGVSYHGIAFNVDVDSTFFSWINPCGLKGIKIASLSDYLDNVPPTDEVKKLTAQIFSEIFSLEIVDIHYNLTL